MALETGEPSTLRSWGVWSLRATGALGLVLQAEIASYQSWDDAAKGHWFFVHVVSYLFFASVWLLLIQLLTHYFLESALLRSRQPEAWNPVIRTLNDIAKKIKHQLAPSANIQTDPDHRYRFTLFRYQALKEPAKFWQYRRSRGWLVPVVRSGKKPRDTDTCFCVKSRKQAFFKGPTLTKKSSKWVMRLREMAHKILGKLGKWEDGSLGVAGAAWDANGTIPVLIDDNLANIDFTKDLGPNDLARVEAYAKETFSTAEHITDWAKEKGEHKEELPKCLVAMLVMVDDVPWGVVVYDSPDKRIPDYLVQPDNLFVEVIGNTLLGVIR